MANETLFIEAILVGSGVFLILSAAALSGLEFADSEDIRRGRTWLSNRWRTLSRQSGFAIVLIGMRWLRDLLDRAVITTVVDFDRSHFFGPMVMSVVVIILPSAALLNAVIGGSKVMVAGYLICIGALSVINLLDAYKRCAALTSALAIVVAVVWFVYLPFHAFQAFTDHIMLTPITHSTVATVFITVLCYSGSATTWMIFRSGRGFAAMRSTERFFARALFALPSMYVLYWLSQLAGYVSLPQIEATRDWLTIASLLLIGSIAFSLVLHFIDFAVSLNSPSKGFLVFFVNVAVAALAILATAAITGRTLPYADVFEAGARVQFFSSDFWIVHSSAVPVLLLTFAILFLFLAWIVTLTARRNGWIEKRPFAAAGFCALLTGTILLVGIGAFT